MPNRNNPYGNQGQPQQGYGQDLSYSASFDPSAYANQGYSGYSGFDQYGGYGQPQQGGQQQPYSSSFSDPNMQGQYGQAAYSDPYAQQMYGQDAYGQDPYADPYGQMAPPQKKRGGGFYFGIIMACIALVAGIGTGIFLFMQSTQIVPAHRSGELGQLDGKTSEEIQAELDRVVEEGMFNIAIANVVQLLNGTSEGDFSIENSPANRYNMKVDIALADTGQTIYSSDIIEPNFHVQYAKLSVPLSKGTYNCIATFHALDPENDDKEIGQASAAMTIIVIN